jgi:hypothetical protein
MIYTKPNFKDTGTLYKRKCSSDGLQLLNDEVNERSNIDGLIFDGENK